MKNKSVQLLLLAPLLFFGVGVWLCVWAENGLRVHSERAQAEWRRGNYAEAIRLYEFVSKHYPASRYADNALWEMATIYYVNLFDVHQTMSHLDELVAQYPDSPLVQKAHLKLAEIYQRELRDLPRAVESWERVLATEKSPTALRPVVFKLANAYFKLNRFDEALKKFGDLIADDRADGLTEKSYLGAGTILQLQKRYRESIHLFSRVSGVTSCAECRLQTQLGLIESYVCVDDLPKAIETTRSVNSQKYTEEMKRSLVARLVERERYSEPKLWDRP